MSRALDPYRFSGLCLYDKRTTPQPLRELALASDADIVTAEGRRPNARVRPASEVLRDIAVDGHLAALEGTAPVVANLNCVAARPVWHGLHRALGPPMP